MTIEATMPAPIKVSKRVFQEIVATHQWMESMPAHLQPTRKLGSSFYENIAQVFRSFIPKERTL